MTTSCVAMNPVKRGMGASGRTKALTVLMFSIVFALVRPLAPIPLFTGFIATQLVVIVGLVLRDKQDGVTSNNNGE